MTEQPIPEAYFATREEVAKDLVKQFSAYHIMTLVSLLLENWLPADRDERKKFLQLLNGRLKRVLL